MEAISIFSAGPCLGIAGFMAKNTHWEFFIPLLVFESTCWTPDPSVRYIALFDLFTE